MTAEETIRSIVRDVLTTDDPSALHSRPGLRGEIERMVADEIYARTGDVDFCPERACRKLGHTDFRL